MDIRRPRLFLLNSSRNLHSEEQAVPTKISDVTRSGPVNPSEFGAVVAVCAMGICGYGFAAALPVMLGVIAEALRFDEQQVGWLGSVELFGMLGGALLAAAVLKPGRHRRIAATSLGLIAAGIAVAVVARSFPGFFAARLLGGIGGGMAYSISVACMGMTAAPARNFGILSAVVVLTGAAEMTAVPWVAPRWGILGPFGILALECGFAALMLNWLPTSRLDVPSRSDTPEKPSPVNALAAGSVGFTFLAAVSLYHLAPTVFWTYGEPLGALSGLSRSGIGSILTASTLAGAGACLLAGKLGTRWGQLALLIVTGVLLGILMLSWVALPHRPSIYLFQAILTFCAWEFATVFQLGMATTLDSTGRLAILVPVAQGIGQGTGPFAGALALGMGYSLPEAVALGALAVIAGILLYGGLLVASKRHPLEDGRQPADAANARPRKGS